MLKRFKLWLDRVKKKEIILYLSLVVIMTGGILTVMLSEEIVTAPITASTTAAATVIAAISFLIIESLSFDTKTFQSKTAILKAKKLITSLSFNSHKGLTNSKFFKSIRFSIFKHLLPKSKREEILGDLIEVKQAMIEENEPWLVIQYKLSWLKIGILLEQLRGKIMQWIEEQIKIIK